jgi:ADP-heptose:LPS heptosyltransferase
LMKSMRDVDELAGAEPFSNLPPERIAYDTGIPMFSVPRYLPMTPETVPAEVPYLRVPEHYIATAVERIRSNSDRLNVGLCWQTGGDYRTIPVNLFRPLADIPGVRLFALGEPEVVEPQIAGSSIISLAATDILTTAGAIAALDLVISVDTMVCHLAGALARPTWLLLQQIPTWRWGMEGASTPWYPTVRLFRQETRDWQPVIERIRAELVSLQPHR